MTVKPRRGTTDRARCRTTWAVRLSMLHQNHRYTHLVDCSIFARIDSSSTICSFRTECSCCSIPCAPGGRREVSEQKRRLKKACNGVWTVAFVILGSFKPAVAPNARFAASSCLKRYWTASPNGPSKRRVNFFSGAVRVLSLVGSHCFPQLYPATPQICLSDSQSLL